MLDLEPHFDLLNFLTQSWCGFHYTMQIILQPFFIHIDIPTLIIVFTKTSFHVNSPGPFFEDGFGERYVNTPVVINEEGSSIPLDKCELSSTELPHHPY